MKLKQKIYKIKSAIIGKFNQQNGWAEGSTVTW